MKGQDINKEQLKLSGRIKSSEVSINSLTQCLDDKRMAQHIDINGGIWYMYRKQTAEFLLDNFDIKPKK